MKNWFESDDIIHVSLEKVILSFKDLGKHYSKLVSLMPGLTSVELIDEGKDFITIKTNEGLMKRVNIVVSSNEESFNIEFDEDYQAGKMINVQSHYVHCFKSVEEGVLHSVRINQMKASGFMGFFYKTFGKASIGKAVLKSYRKFFSE